MARSIIRSCSFPEPLLIRPASESILRRRSDYCCHDNNSSLECLDLIILPQPELFKLLLPQGSTTLCFLDIITSVCLSFSHLTSLHNRSIGTFVLLTALYLELISTTTTAVASSSWCPTNKLTPSFFKKSIIYQLTTYHNSKSSQWT